jgi:hypothetical protein
LPSRNANVNQDIERDEQMFCKLVEKGGEEYKNKKKQEN